MVELADTHDSKSCASRHVGSTPTSGTKKFWGTQSQRVSKPTQKPTAIVILGPTASGKTELSIELAKKINGEIISADSRQVYKGLNIGTGKVTKKEMGKIPHHLLDVANPKTKFSVARYQKLANQKIKEILARGKTPIIVGGTGFYIQAIVDNLVLPEVAPNRELRAKLKTKTATELFEILKKLDPARARDIDRHNPARLVRAIEIAKALGQVPKLKKGTKSPCNFIQIGLNIEPEKLAGKIHRRLLARLKQGLIAEVKNLHQQGLSWKRMEELGLEYRYLARFLQGKINRDQALKELEQEINRYAKRQMTWFKKDKNIIWFDPTDKKILGKILAVLS